MKKKLVAATVLGLVLFGAAFLAGGSTYAFLTDTEKIGGGNGSVEFTAAACFDDYDGYKLKWDRHAEKCLDRDGYYHDEIKKLYPSKMDVDEKAGYFHVFAEIPDIKDVNHSRFRMKVDGKHGEIPSAWATCKSDIEMCRVDFNKSDVIELANGTGRYELVLHGEWMDGTKYEARSELTLYDGFHWWLQSESIDSQHTTQADEPPAPTGVTNFTARYLGGAVNVTVDANASLTGIQVTVDDGVDTSVLNSSAWTNRTRNGNYTYTASHAPTRNGTHNVTLVNVTDHLNDTVVVDDTVQVNVTGVLDDNASTNTSLNGSVNASTNTTLNGTQTGNNTTTANTTNASADITVSYGVHDTELVEGSNASVSVEANNTGNASGNTSITVYLDGSAVTSATVAVDAMSRESRSFEFPLGAGDHEVRVNSLNATTVTVQPLLEAGLSLNQSRNVSGTVRATLESNLPPTSALFTVTGSSGQVNSTNVTNLLKDGTGTVDWNSSAVDAGDYVLELSVRNGTQTAGVNASVTVPPANTSSGSLNTSSSTTNSTSSGNTTNSTS